MPEVPVVRIRKKDAVNNAYWIRRLLVGAFERDAKRKKLDRDEVNYHWPHPVPKDCKCTIVKVCDDAE